MNAGQRRDILQRYRRIGPHRRVTLRSAQGRYVRNLPSPLTHRNRNCRICTIIHMIRARSTDCSPCSGLAGGPGAPGARTRPDAPGTALTIAAYHHWPGATRLGTAHDGRLPCTMRALYFRFAKLVFQPVAGAHLHPSGSRLDHSMTPYRLLTGPPTQGAGRGADPTG